MLCLDLSSGSVLPCKTGTQKLRLFT